MQEGGGGGWGAGARINLIMRGIERNGELAKHRAAAHKLVKAAANQTD
jgi:hypothetical protein